ncbi:MAG: hypothetical protein FWC54_05935 [Actinomycetia bacterium]|nr:hypothetical protein [Actinomycetes bacterium]
MGKIDFAGNPNAQADMRYNAGVGEKPKPEIIVVEPQESAKQKLYTEPQSTQTTTTAQQPQQHAGNAGMMPTIVLLGIVLAIAVWFVVRLRRRSNL